MAIEQTLSMIKPDGVRRGLIGDVIGRFEKHGLKIRAMKMLHLSLDQARAFYAVHQGTALLRQPDAIHELRAHRGHDPGRRKRHPGQPGPHGGHRLPPGRARHHPGRFRPGHRSQHRSRFRRPRDRQSTKSPSFSTPWNRSDTKRSAFSYQLERHQTRWWHSLYRPVPRTGKVPMSLNM